MRHQVERELRRIDVDASGRVATLRFRGLEAGMVARLKLEGVTAADATPILHGEMAYTINQLPESA